MGDPISQPRDNHGHVDRGMWLLIHLRPLNRRIAGDYGQRHMCDVSAEVIDGDA